MHAVFWMFGKKEYVDRLARWLETRTFFLPFDDPKGQAGFKDAKGKPIKKGLLPIEGVLRYGLFGAWEFVFPKEHMDEVLTTLDFHKNHYSYYGMKLKARKKAMQIALNCKKIPKFNTDKMLSLPADIKDHIAIIPIGIRYDKEDGFGGIAEAL